MLIIRFDGGYCWSFVRCRWMTAATAWNNWTVRLVICAVQVDDFCQCGINELSYLSFVLGGWMTTATVWNCWTFWLVLCGVQMDEYCHSVDTCLLVLQVDNYCHGVKLLNFQAHHFVVQIDDFCHRQCGITELWGLSIVLCRWMASAGTVWNY